MLDHSIRHRVCAALLFLAIVFSPLAYAHSDETVTVTFDDLRVFHYQGDLVVGYQINEGDWAQLERTEAEPTLTIRSPVSDESGFEHHIAIEDTSRLHLVPTRGTLDEHEEIEVALTADAPGVEIRYIRVDHIHGTWISLHILPEGVFFEALEEDRLPGEGFDRPWLRDREYPWLQDRERPWLQDRQRPSLHERQRPSLHDRQRPGLHRPLSPSPDTTSEQ